MKAFLISITFYLPSQPLAAARAILFMDSFSVMQSQLVSEINLVYNYSPTLRSALSVTVYGINPYLEPFSGEIEYRSDAQGMAVAQYRPGPLTYIICKINNHFSNHFTMRHKEQLYLCIPTI